MYLAKNTYYKQKVDTSTGILFFQIISQMCILLTYKEI